jgi:hypothetical protein
MFFIFFPVLFLLREEIPLIRRLAIQQWGKCVEPARDSRVVLSAGHGHPILYPLLFQLLENHRVSLEAMVGSPRSENPSLRHAALLLEVSGSLLGYALDLRRSRMYRDFDRKEFFR